MAEPKKKPKHSVSSSVGTIQHKAPRIQRQSSANEKAKLVSDASKPAIERRNTSAGFDSRVSGQLPQKIPVKGEGSATPNTTIPVNKVPSRHPSPTKLPIGIARRSQSVRIAQVQEDRSNLPTRHQRALSRQGVLDPLAKFRAPTLPAPQTSNLKQENIRDRGTSLEKDEVLGITRLKQDLKTISDRDGLASNRVNPYAPSEAQSTSSGGQERTRHVAANAAVKLSRPVLSSIQQPSAQKRPSTIRPNTDLEKVEVARQQAVPFAFDTHEPNLELLYLHLIHRKSSQTHEQWQKSAKHVYNRRFSELTALDARLEEREVGMLEQHNCAAILDWCGDGSDVTIERKMQVISKAASEAWSLTGPDGRHTAVVQAFEHWYRSVDELLCRRIKGSNKVGGPSEDRFEVLEGLGDGWKAEVASLQNRVVQTAHDLLDLGHVKRHCDLARCVMALSEAFKNLLEELELIGHIEDKIVQRESVWLAESIDRITADLHQRLPIS